ncbi:MAG: hypothetical protein LBC39_03670 [Methanobrevibacter sp.]|jgi:hypothetical protein|nr:hypothetical protein [Candidatus Methanovirga aequatorialis]
MILILMAIGFISMVCYVFGEIFLVRRSIFTFYMFIISDFLIILQLFLNNTLVENFNVAFIELFSVAMSIIGVYNWMRIKQKDI